MEYDRKGFALARDTYPKARFFNLGVYDDPTPLIEAYPAGFDAVVSTEVIEHLYAPDSLVQLANRVLKPGGLLVISTPYHGYLKNLAIALLDKWDDHHTTLWEGGHIKFWSRRTLSALLEKHGFEIVGFDGAGRLPLLWKSMMIEAIKRV